MTKYIPLLLLLFSFLEAQLPAYEMQRYCKDEAVAKYKIPRDRIHLAVPRYLYGKYSVYGQSPKKVDDALFFVCDFSRSGRFLGIKTDRDLRQKGEQANQNAKRSCKSEAASVWRVPRKSVRIAEIRKVNRTRYHIRVGSGNKTALCDVNAQGHIYSFKREQSDARLPRKAKRACVRSAEKFWRLHTPRIRVEQVKKNRFGRYNVLIRYKNVRGRCDVDRNGYVHHFKTQK
jgi:hypothetical protein